MTDRKENRMARPRSGSKKSQSPAGLPEMPGAMHRVVFAPSILASDFANLEREVRKCRRVRCPWIHVDVMDYHFVPNLTIGPPGLKSIARAVPDLFYDAHLMVENPQRLAEDFIKAGASMITFHTEAVDDPPAFCRWLHSRNVRAGVSLRPRTPLEAIEPVLTEIDLVLVMTVEPGFGGQELIPQTLNKIRDLRRLRDSNGGQFLIQADGGINESTLSLVVAAGAEVLVMGTAIFGGGAVRENVRRLRGLLGRTPV
jgi:ribulose-phosphate 3-epimerase